MNGTDVVVPLQNSQRPTLKSGAEININKRKVVSLLSRRFGMDEQGMISGTTVHSRTVSILMESNCVSQEKAEEVASKLDLNERESEVFTEAMVFGKACVEQKELQTLFSRNSHHKPSKPTEEDSIESSLLPPTQENIPGILENGKIIVMAGEKTKLPLGLIVPNPDQPRKYFSEESLASLGRTYEKKRDVKNPILVTIRNNGQGDFALIVDGERRWRAAKKIGLVEISCLICEEMSDDEVFESSAIANLNRESMSPIEEAYVITRFQKKGRSLDEITTIMGRSIQTLRNILKYLGLIDEIQGLLMTGGIEKGLALKLASYPKEHQQWALKTLRDEIVKRGGKPLHPNEAARVLRGASQKVGIVPQKSKKGKRLRTHEEMVLGNVQIKGNEFLKSLFELFSLEDCAIEKVTEPHPLDISDLVGRIMVNLKKAKEKFSYST